MPVSLPRPSAAPLMVLQPEKETKRTLKKRNSIVCFIPPPCISIPRKSLMALPIGRQTIALWLMALPIGRQTIALWLMALPIGRQTIALWLVLFILRLLFLKRLKLKGSFLLSQNLNLFLRLLQKFRTGRNQAHAFLVFLQRLI